MGQPDSWTTPACLYVGLSSRVSQKRRIQRSEIVDGDSLLDYHHHHFICPIIQQYAHLREYGLEEQDSKVR